MYTVKGQIGFVGNFILKCPKLISDNSDCDCDCDCDVKTRFTHK